MGIDSEFPADHPGTGICAGETDLGEKMADQSRCERAALATARKASGSHL